MLITAFQILLLSVRYASERCADEMKSKLNDSFSTCCGIRNYTQVLNNLDSFAGKMTGTGMFHGVGVVQFHDFELYCPCYLEEKTDCETSYFLMA